MKFILGIIIGMVLYKIYSEDKPDVYVMFSEYDEFDIYYSQN